MTRLQNHERHQKEKWVFKMKATCKNIELLQKFRFLCIATAEVSYHIKGPILRSILSDDLKFGQVFDEPTQHSTRGRKTMYVNLCKVYGPNRKSCCPRMFLNLKVFKACFSRMNGNFIDNIFKKLFRLALTRNNKR